MKIKGLWKLLLIAIIFQNCDSSSEKTNLSQIEFDEEFILEFSDVKDDELLIKPAMVKTGPSGNIYIADERMKRIQVYNRSGNYLRTVGREGKGPGEFESTPYFTIDSAERMTVLGGRNRRISLFDYSGDLTLSYQPNENTMVWASNYRAVEGGQYLTARKLPERSHNDETFRKNVLHIFDSSFDERVQSFANYYELVENRTDFVDFYTVNTNPGTVWVESGNTVWYVPGTYEGNIFKFEREENEWVLGQTLQGVMLNDTAVEIPTGNDHENQISTFHVFSGDGPFTGKIVSESLGVFSMSDGSVFHFSNQIKGEERVFLVECFDQNGYLYRKGEINEFNISANSRRTKFGGIWKDSDDRFYLIDERQDPLVRVGKINCEV